MSQSATRHVCALHGDALMWERGGDDMPTVRGRWRCPTCDVQLMSALDDIVPPRSSAPEDGAR